MYYIQYLFFSHIFCWDAINDSSSFSFAFPFSLPFSFTFTFSFSFSFRLLENIETISYRIFLPFSSGIVSAVLATCVVY